MSETEDAERFRPGEPTERGEGEEGFPHGSAAPFVTAFGIFGTCFGFIFPLAWIVGVPALAAGIGLWIKEYAVDEFESGVVPEQKRQLLGVPSVYLAGLLAIISELLLFGGAFVAWFFLSARRGPFPNRGLPALSVVHGLYETAVLVVGAVVIFWGVRRVRNGDRSGITAAIAVPFVAGIAYLGLVWYDWQGLLARGLSPTAGAYGAAFYFLTGLHAVHVLGALIFLGVMGYRYWGRDHFSENRFTMVRIGEAYWYFLTAVSVVMLLLVYLPSST